MDIFHEVVKSALIKDGWTITHDPLTLSVGIRKVFIDLAGERLIAGEKNGEKIAVEVKSFLGRSDITELERAIGQYVLYRRILREDEPERKLYIAVEEETYNGIFSEPIANWIVTDEQINLIVFNAAKEEIIQWITETQMNTQRLSRKS
jgi:hypothetical protein